MFENGSPFDLLPISKLARGFLWENDTRLGLPAFQRNAVWKEEKVEMLWDSLLCRFPIGSLLLARQSDFADVGYRKLQINRAADFQELDNSIHDGLIVVDGQQRLNAIALGFRRFESGHEARLWVDLKPSKDEKNSSFSFYVCTSDNPFGVGLSKEEKRQAFQNVERDDLLDESLGLDETYPFKAHCPVPLVELCDLLGNNLNWEQIKDYLLHQNVLNLKENVLSFLRQKSYETLDTQSPYLKRLEKGLRFVAINGEYAIPVILVEREKQGFEITTERLGKLFERVNISGERPSEAEMFFSALKLKAPIINDYVAQVYNDPEIGRLFKPTDIVLNALRLADYKITGLSLDRFEEIAQKNHSGLMRLLESGDGTPSIFLRSLRHAYRALHHNGQPGDIGLPRMFLQRLRPRVWQTVSWWVYQNLDEIDKQGITIADRLNILRYSILDTFNYFFSIGEHGKAKRVADWTFFTTEPMQSLQSGKGFDIHGIIQNIRQKLPEWNIKEWALLYPSRYQEKVVAGWFSLSNEVCLLMYAQRDVLRNWEKYDLDIDHIVPSVWMYFRAGSKKKTNDFWKVENRSDDFGRFVLNTIGNKRFWPASLNRSDGDNSPGYKLSTVNASDSARAAYGLNSKEDIMSASFINPDEFSGWSELACPTKNRDWDTARFQKFKQLVDERRIRMYSHLYETLQMAELS